MRKVEPKLFGLHKCRVCDHFYDLIDMNPEDMGICLECQDKITLGLIDESGKELE